MRSAVGIPVVHGREDVKTYADNVLAALRTGGGLLIGNSVLIYYKVIPTTVTFDTVLNLGLLLVAVGSCPVTAVIKLFEKGDSNG
jgi:hypothetical protein